MSKEWYPIIDSEKCSGCLACYNKCRNGVFTIENEKPKVVNPEGCVTRCHGCGNLCPEQAIVYYGEVTGIPTCSCGGNCN